MAEARPDASLNPAPALRANPRFRRFCVAKFLQLVAQNSLIYGLFIFVVRDQESSLATSAFVLASVIPSVFLSVPAGVLADALPKKLMLLAALAGRIAVVWLFIDLDFGLGTVLALSFLAWTAYQFFTPPENAALLAVVPESSLPGAISFLQALSLLAQLIGAGIAAPLLIKFTTDQVLFWFILTALISAAAIYVSIPRLSQRGPGQSERIAWWKALPVGLRTIRTIPALRRTTTLRILLDTGMMMVIVAVPVYVEDVLQTGAENTIYIAAPGAIGVALGLLLTPRLLHVISGPALTTVGFSLFLIVLLLLPWAGELSPHINVDGISQRIVFTSLVLPFAGLGVSITQVASRAVVYRLAGYSHISQVLATQSAIGSAAALIPTIAAGLLLDLLPVQAVLVLIGLTLAVIAWGNGVRSIFSPPTPAKP